MIMNNKNYNNYNTCINTIINFGNHIIIIIYNTFFFNLLATVYSFIIKIIIVI